MNSLIASVGTDGRKYYKPEAIEAAVNDIVTKRARVAEVAERLDISRATVYLWLRRHKDGKPNQGKAGRPFSGTESLLEKALSHAVKASHKDDLGLLQRLELLQAYAKGTVDRDQVKAALGVSGRFEIPNWAGELLITALRSGYTIKK